MPKFLSAFDHSFFSPTECGSLTRPTYRDKVYENGSIGVEKTGDFDLDGMIQSSRDECLIYNILERCASNPDILNQFRGNFVDVVSDQITFAEHLQRSIDLQNSFNSLPVDLRKLFDNNIHEFITALNDGTVDSKVKGFYQLHPEYIKPADHKVDVNIDSEVE